MVAQNFKDGSPNTFWENVHPSPLVNFIQSKVHRRLVDPLPSDHWDGFTQTEEERHYFGGEADLISHQHPSKSLPI